MSYSYIKSVFPNFENSSKVYDDTIYNNIQSAKKEKTNNTPTYNVQQNDPYTFSNFKSDQETIVLPQTNLLETFNNAEYNAEYNTPDKQGNNNNLSFYNLPLHSQELNNSQGLNKSQGLNNSRAIQLPNRKLKTIENFESGGDTCDEDCDKYVKHITNCEKCKSILMKQLNIESDNKRNEELMELISYLIFAIFILLLINSLKTPK